MTSRQRHSPAHHNAIALRGPTAAKVTAWWLVAACAAVTGCTQRPPPAPPQATAPSPQVTPSATPARVPTAAPEAHVAAASPGVRAGAPPASPPIHSWTRHVGDTELWLTASALVPGRLAHWQARWTDHRRGEPLDAAHLSVTAQCNGNRPQGAPPPRPSRHAEHSPGTFRWRWAPRRGCTLTLRVFTASGSVAAKVPLTGASDDPSVGFPLAKPAQWQAQVRVAPVTRRLLRAALETEVVIHAAADAQQTYRAPAAGRVARLSHGAWPRALGQVLPNEALLQLALTAPRSLEGLPAAWLPLDASRRDRTRPRAAWTLHSDVRGSISRVFVHPGQRVTAGAPLLTVVDETRLTLAVRLPPAQLRGLGDKLQLLLLPELDKAVVVAMASAQANDAGDLVVPYRSPLRTWRHGERVAAAIEHGPAHEVVAVPAAAVLAAGPQRYVFVQRSGVRFARQPLSLGPWSGDAYPVLSGLRAGDHVVVSGFDRVREALASARASSSAGTP